MLNPNHNCKWAADEPTHRRHNLLKQSLNSLFNLLTALLTVSFLTHCFLMHTQAPHHVVLICMNGIRLHSFGFNCRFALWLPMKRGRASGRMFVYIVKDIWKDFLKKKMDKQRRSQRSLTSLHYQHIFSSNTELGKKHKKCTARMAGHKQTNKQTQNSSVPTTNQRSKA